MRASLWTGCAWLVAATGLCQERTADVSQGTNMAVALSPDRAMLAVDLVGQLWHLPLSGGAANPLTPPTAIARNPRFSPDGRLLVYQSRQGTQWDLWLVELRGGGLRRLTDSPHNETAPDFAPGGGSVVFVSDRAGRETLWALDIASGATTQLTDGPGQAAFPSVSERGEIAYVNRQDGRWSLALLRDGRSSEILSEPYPLTAPSWRPGGGVIVFNEQPAPGQSHLAMVLLDAVPLKKRLTRGEDVFGFRAAWISPGEFVYTADGRLWRRALAEATRDPIQLFARIALSGPSERRRTVRFPPPRTAAEAPYVIQVDRLFDGLGGQYRRHMDVHVNGQRIRAVVARGLEPLPERVIDARDATLMPGLIDLHAHPPETAAQRAGRAWLAYGVTTVREVGSDPDGWRAGMARKAAWSAQALTGPRLLLTAPPPGPAEPATVPGGAFDVFELYRGASGQLTPRVLNRVRALGVPVFGQTLFPAARFGIDGLEHLGARAHRPYSLERSALDRSYQDVFGVLIETRIAVTPALAAFGGFPRLARQSAAWSRDDAYLRLFSTAERARWEAAPAASGRLDNLQRFVARLARSGGRVTAGSDAPAVPYGLGLHAELALLSQAGLANDAVLRAATAEAARALGIEHHLGTVEPGKLADFVILRGDPLARIEDTLDIEAVVKDGLWTDREQLLTAP